jgi:cell division protein ZapD
MLSEMERVGGVLLAQGKMGLLRDNEWLVSLRGRLTVAGGATQFDMPSFHAWQHKSSECRRADILRWIEPLRALYEGLGLALRVLRDAGERVQRVADLGYYQQMLGGKTYQLARVWVDPAHGVFPEVSANKHMASIRFASQEGDAKPQPAMRAIPFEMSLCTL